MLRTRLHKSGHHCLSLQPCDSIVYESRTGRRVEAPICLEVLTLNLARRQRQHEVLALDGNIALKAR